METPSYIKSLLTPTTKVPQGRKVWNVDLEAVWLPFFTATNASGDTAIPNAAIGAPLRLAYDKAGQVRFSTAGRPTIRVAKELGDNIKMVRDNFTANLIGYAGMVSQHNPEAVKAQLELNRKAGEPIANYDRSQLSVALKARAEQEQAEQAEQAEAEAIAKTKAVKSQNREKVTA